MRGNSLITLTSTGLTKTAGQKHRKGLFTDERDNTLASRFYYHSSLKQLNLEASVDNLVREFHLSGNVIIQRLSARTDYLKQLKANKTTAKMLQKKYPFYNWK